MRSHAKATSAESNTRRANGLGRNRIALACLFALLAFAGSGASSALAADPPLAATEDAGAVGNTGATLNGKVNPKGSAVSVCRFEYGTTVAYGAALPCTPASLGTGGFNVAVSVDLDALEAGTTYHYRVIASSVNGANQGADRTFTTTGTPACPNAKRRLEQGILAIQLPDCMALEQVSPPVKGSQRAATPTISADGQRISFKSLAFLAESPGNVDATNGDRYVATRGDDGWIPAPTVPPAPYTRGWQGGLEIARSFDPSLTRWVVLASAEEESQLSFGIAQLFRGELGGVLDPTSPLLVPLDSSAGNSNVNGAELQGASADHRRLLFAPGETKATYLPGDPVPTPGFDKSIYLVQLDALGDPSLKLLTRDETGGDAGKVWGGNCGARVGDAIGTTTGSWRTQGAVSLDGSRVYLTTRPGQPEGVNCNSATNKLRIMERTETAGAADLEELIASECDRAADPGPPVVPECGKVASGKTVPDGDDLYQGASVDGKRVYFMTNRQLADTDTDGFDAFEFSSACVGFLVGGCDLYLFDAEEPEGERLTQVSAGGVAPGHAVPGQGANVLNGTVAISGDGTHVYFAATGVLTPDPNPEGKTAAEPPASTPKLYVWDTDSEEVRFVGVLNATDSGLWGNRGTFLGNAYPVPATGTDGSGTEVGGRGDILVFQTKAALTADDTDGAFLDTFRYDGSSSSPTLTCVSCKPGGPDGEAIATEFRGPNIQLFNKYGTAFAEENRWVSEDGKTILIRTFQAQLPSDLNGTRNDYLWQEGRLTMLPGSNPPASLLSATGDYLPVLSHDGSMVAFTAYPRLLPSDIDTASDVYVARPGGGFPFPEPEPGCEGEACQGAATPAPAATGAASQSARSQGNIREGTGANRNCTRQARRALRLSRAAKRLRQASARASSPRAKRRTARQARRVAKRAKRASAGAKRCRRANRGVAR